MFQHAGFVSGEFDLVIFKNHPSTCPGNLKSIASRGLSGGGNKHPGGTIRIFEIGSDIILNLNIVKATTLSKTADFAGHADQPLQRVELVQALVEQHTTSFALPGGSPPTRGIVGFCAEPVGNDPIDAYDVSQVSIGDQFFQFQVARFGA